MLAVHPLRDFFPIRGLFDLVNAHNPVIARESLLQVCQLDVFVPNFVMADAIKARGDVGGCPHLCGKYLLLVSFTFVPRNASPARTQGAAPLQIDSSRACT